MFVAETGRGAVFSAHRNSIKPLLERSCIWLAFGEVREDYPCFFLWNNLFGTSIDNSSRHFPVYVAFVECIIVVGCKSMRFL
ncbi:hypothetical protein M378DRAFT_169032 [Amanita muscaria Koide BX008]|uniref:Uncharacterized protein n=1 Tax=Amanita muscaria (strain Koide BX008) TaxID=946122 RepID=A0A0C2WTH5_AMAMK|nr:hypothetical protein M378DRAFT_169032 [Amanita muscaria Koide BX008]